MDLAQRAIEEALGGNWEEALRLNKQILKENPTNKEALNRLARASFELGDIEKARTCYKRVLKLDPYNTIARKVLTRIGGKRVKGSKKQENKISSSPLQINLFLEESGKTKSVSLIHLGDETVINDLAAGEEVKLIPHAHRVSIQTQDGHYVGRLPDDLSRRLIELTRVGNKYRTLIKAISLDTVKVFIREIKSSPVLGNLPSFPSSEKLNYVSFTSPDFIHEEKPDTSSFEDELEERR